MRKLYVLLVTLILTDINAFAQQEYKYPCKDGYLAGFDGQGYIQAEWPNIFPTSLTIAAWVRSEVDLPSGKEMGIYYRFINGNTYPYASGLHGLVINQKGEFMFRGMVSESMGIGYGTIDSLSSGFVPTKGKFYHVAVTFDDQSKVCTIYVNGEIKATKTFNGILNYPYGINYKTGSIGCVSTFFGSFSTSNYFTGYIDDVIIATKALNKVQLDSLAFNSDELKDKYVPYGIGAHWTFTEGRGTATQSAYYPLPQSTTGFGKNAYFYNAAWAICNSSANKPPIADAGPDQVINPPANSVTLEGDGSKDPDGNIVSYAWIKLSGPQGDESSIVSPNSVVTSIIGLKEGEYVFELTVKDDKGSEAKDEVKIIVSSVNRLPIVDAGPDQVILLPDDFVTLTGTATDEDGIIVRQNWTKVKGPDLIRIVSPDNLKTVVESLKEGEYVFELTVKDDKGGEAKDEVSVKVNPRVAEYIRIANLRVYADFIPNSKDNPRIVSGNVFVVPNDACDDLSRVLYLGGKVSVDTVLNIISGDGIIQCNEIGTHGNVPLYNGNYTLYAIDNVLSWNSFILSDLFDLSKFGISLKSVKILCDGVQINGKIKLVDFLIPKEFSIDSLFFTHKGIDFAGGIKLANLKLKGIGLDQLNLKYDSYNKIFEGEVRVESMLFNVDASTKWKNAKIDEFHLGIAVEKPFVRLPLLAGWGIDSIGGGISNLSEPITDPQKRPKMSLGARISPVINYAIPSFGNLILKGSYEFGTSFTGEANYTFFNQNVTGGEITYSSDLFKLKGTVDLYDVLKGDAQFSVNTDATKSKLSGSFMATLKMPKIKIWGLKYLNKLYEEKEYFSTSNYVTNTYLAGTARISLPRVPRIFYILHWKDGWEYDFSRGSGIIPLDAHAELSLRKISSRILGAPRVYSFNLDTPADHLIITAKSSDVPPDLSVYLANGDTLSIENAGNHKNVLHVPDTDEGITTYCILNPLQGIYYLWSNNADSVEVSKINHAPAVSITNAIENASQKKLSISFITSNTDNNTTIKFGFDDDKNNADGIELAENILQNSNTGNIILDYSGVKSGIYYLYAGITDSIGQHRYVYYDKPFTVIANSSLVTPSGFSVLSSDSSLIFRFQKNNKDEDLNYIIHYSNVPNSLNLNSTNFAIGDTSEIELSDFLPGKYYEFAISVIDSNGNESDLSNIVQLTWTPKSVNKFPSVITDNISGSVKSGAYYSYQIKAVDPDNDPLSYTLMSAPGDMQISQQGLINWTPSDSHIGHHNFCIKVSDSNGGADSVWLKILVYDDNLSIPVVSFNKSMFSSYQEKGIIEISDAISAYNENIQTITAKIFSSSDTTGINIVAEKSAGDLPLFSAQLGFTNAISSENNIHVQKGDTLWIQYKKDDNTVVNYSLFDYLKADFFFKDSLCSTDTVIFFNTSKGANLTYTWLFNNDRNEISNEINPKRSFKVQNAQRVQQIPVQLIISNTQHSSDTLIKIISVFNNITPEINSNGMPICEGDSIIISTLSEEGSFQWYRDQVIIPGATQKEYTATIAGSYTVNITNSSLGCSSMSDVKVLTMVAKPTKPSILFIDNMLTSSITDGNQWFVNGTIIPGAIGQQYTPSQAGDYTVQASVDGCTSPVSETYHFTGIDIPSSADTSLLDDAVKFYPNPFSNTLKIFNKRNTILGLRLYDITGREVLYTEVRPGNQNIPVERLQHGMYIALLINLKEGTWARKILLKL